MQPVALRTEPSQADDVRRLLREAAEALSRSEGLLRDPGREPRALVDGSLEVVERSFRAFLAWNSVPLREEAPLRELARLCRELDSSFTTTAHLAAPIAELRERVAGGGAPGIDDREAADRSVYTARNTFRTTLAALPQSVRPTG